MSPHSSFFKVIPPRAIGALWDEALLIFWDRCSRFKIKMPPEGRFLPVIAGRGRSQLFDAEADTYPGTTQGSDRAGYVREVAVESIGVN